MPFKAEIKAGEPMVMVGHISAINVTIEKLPSSFSKKMITDVLRETLGYTGIVITDSMEMGVIANLYKSSETAYFSINAG